MRYRTTFPARPLVSDVCTLPGGRCITPIEANPYWYGGRLRANIPLGSDRDFWSVGIQPSPPLRSWHAYGPGDSVLVDVAQMPVTGAWIAFGYSSFGEWDRSTWPGDSKAAKPDSFFALPAPVEFVTHT